MFTSDETLSVGIPEIDEEHGALNELIRRLEKAVIVSESVDEVRERFTELLAATKSHFENEERILSAYPLKRMVEHKAEHAKLLEDLSAIAEDFTETDREWRRNLFNLTDIMNQHVITFDMEVKDFVVQSDA